MEQPEKYNLKQEIAFRGRLIEALLASNEELRVKCNQLLSLIQSKKDVYSLSERELVEKLTNYSLSGAGQGFGKKTQTCSGKECS